MKKIFNIIAYSTVFMYTLASNVYATAWDTDFGTDNYAFDALSGKFVGTVKGVVGGIGLIIIFCFYLGIIAAPFVCCYLIGKKKGYDPCIALLGLVSLLGIIIVLVLPDRNADNNTKKQ